jgi:hypothetical protein
LEAGRALSYLQQDRRTSLIGLPGGVNLGTARGGLGTCEKSEESSKEGERLKRRPGHSGQKVEEIVVLG